MNTLVAKLAAVSLKVGSLTTDKKNASQNYEYISADKVLDRAGSALAEAGIVLIPSITTEDVKEVAYTDNYGKPRTRYDAVINFGMVLSDGEGELTALWVSRGSDYADPAKALFKAITSGHKYFLMKLFNIGVGNEDGEHETEPPSPATPKASTQAQSTRPTAPKSTQAQSTQAQSTHPEEDFGTPAKSASKSTQAAVVQSTTPLALCPHCHAPAGKPHAKTCPEANGAVAEAEAVPLSEEDQELADLAEALSDYLYLMHDPDLKFSADALGVFRTLRDLDKVEGAERMTPKQHGYIGALLDKVYAPEGQEIHRPMLAALVGRVVIHTQPLPYACKTLFDWLKTPEEHPREMAGLDEIASHVQSIYAEAEQVHD